MTVGLLDEDHGYGYIGNITFEILRDAVNEGYAQEKCEKKFLDENGEPLGRGCLLFAANSFLDPDNMGELLRKLGVEDKNIDAVASVLDHLQSKI